MRCFLAYLLFLLSFFSFGQNQSSVTKKDSLTILKYKQLMAQHINPNPDSALFYIKKIKVLTTKLNYGIGIVEADYLHASYFRRLQNSDSAIFYFNKALLYAKKINYKKGIAVSNNGLCHVYYRMGLLDNAINTCNECLVVAKQMNDLAIIPDSYIALGNIYLRQNDLKQALKYVLKVDSIHNTQELRQDIIAAAFQSIGIIYLELGQLNKSEEYFLKANNEFKKMPIDPTYYLHTTKWHLGEVYYKQGNLKKADSILLDSYDFFNEIKDNRTVAEISKYLGLMNLEFNKMNAAENYLLNAFNLHKEFQNEYEVSFAALELGKLYIKQEKPKKAIDILKHTLQYKTSQKNSFIKQEIYLILSKAYAKENIYNNAYVSLQNSARLKDSLQNVQNVVQISEIEEKYQSEKKEKEIVLLKSQNELAEQQKTNQRNILLGGIGVSSLAGLFFFFLYRNRQKTNRKLKEIDTLKSNFFANISHEFRTPLTLISAPLEKRLEKPKLSKDDRTDFEMMQRSSNRLLNLVDQLLDLSKLESGNLKLKVKQGNLTPLLKSLGSSFKHLANQKNIDYKIAIQHSDIAWFDKDVIEKIVINLLSNAFKYTPENGTINFRSVLKNNKLQLDIENSGMTLSEEKMKQIFNRFYQDDSTAEGVGIGLALVKELVTLSHGTIKTATTTNSTILFTVVLPIDEIDFAKDELVTSKDAISITNEYESKPLITSKKTAKHEKTIDEDQPILLVVEDSADVRDFISRSFSKSYQIIQAENGHIGIEKAIEFVPDLIISDIMMPETTGLELCDRLKKDERTSHIPIILLTAKVGEEDQYTGLETGADDYITKPFKIKLLETRIKNLVASRKLLRDRYSQEVILKPKDIAITPVDEQFLERIQKVMNEKLVESSFSIEEFSQSVGMSRMQLHRKLKALTGLSASEFIRSQRLKLAAQLLKKSEINVSQVGYSVGFNDHAYFSKCFKEMYHCTPTEYVKNTNH